ncbi:MAG TPA: FkbM family methyltransferase [Aliidongia sp.]|nr:FkbM family methyltransferase [Aliidongia sp.]
MLNDEALCRELDRLADRWDRSANPSSRLFEADRTAELEFCGRPLVLIGATPYAQAFARQGGALDIVVACDNAAAGCKLDRFDIVPEGELAGLKRRYPRLLALLMVESKGAAAHFSAYCEVQGIEWLGLIHAYRRSGFAFPAVQAKFYEGLFDSAWCRRDQWQSVAASLDDALSRSVFHSVLLFRLTGERRYLEAANSASGLAGEPSWLRGDIPQVYVDGGAYDGDTVLRFIEKNGTSYEQIYAFEPDAGNFALLEERTRDLPRIQRFQQGLYSDRRTLRFAAGNDQGSYVSEAGEIVIEVAAIDQAVDRPVTAIKLDVEGSEAAALQGAVGQIAANRPGLCVSAYHQCDDLFALPAQLRAVHPDYKLSLRQFTPWLYDTNLYCH